MNARSAIGLLIVLLTLPFALGLDVPAPVGFVNDRAGMLSPAEAAQLEMLLQEIERNGTVEIAVLTIPSLEDESLEEYATRVFREWGVGKEDADNGALILIVQDTRRIRIEVGYGLEGVLTDASAGMIIRNRIAPAFREGRYHEGLAAAAQEIALLAAGDPATASRYAGPQLGAGDIISTFLLSVGYLILVVYSAVKISDRKRKWKLRGFGILSVFVVASILSFIFTTFVLWVTMFFCIMILSWSSGFIFIPGGGFGGGRFGGGGFGGGSSGGGGGSGGW